jgi:multiple sugar transport system permease protein
VGFVLLTVFPLGYALWLSLTNWDGVSPNWSFVGFRNYARLFQDDQTIASLGRTGLFTLITVPIAVVSGLALAVLVNRPLLGRGIWRTLFYLPAVVPPVAAALTFKMLFNRDTGAANGVIEAVGGDPIPWLADPYVRTVLIFLVLWGVGGSMIISLAGLQDVPKELHEAATVDGANRWQIFHKITLPLISPILFFQVVTGVIGALQVFVPPLLLAPVNGAAGVTTVPEGNYLFMVHVYAEYFAMGHFGYASALLWFLFLVVLVITGIVFKIGRRSVFYAVDPDDRGNRKERA